MPKPKPKFTSYLIRKKLGDDEWDEIEVAKTEPTAESILEKHGEGTYRVTAIGPNTTKTLWEEKLGGVIDKEISDLAEQAGSRVSNKTESVAGEELGQKIETIQKISEHETRLDELQTDVGELKEEVSFLKNWAESNGGKKEETILTADDPQWQRFAAICNRLGNLGKDSPKDVLLLMLRACSNVAEKSGSLNVEIRVIR